MGREKLEPGEVLDEAGSEGRHRRYALEQLRDRQVQDEASDRLRASVAVVQDANGVRRVEM